MHTDPLVKMANQIGHFFEAMPDRPEALEGIAQHIRKFWGASHAPAFSGPRRQRRRGPAPAGVAGSADPPGHAAPTAATKLLN